MSFKKQQPYQPYMFKDTLLPLAPIVVIDDEISIGHYCHSEPPALDGYRLNIQDNKTPKLINNIIGNKDKSSYISNLTPEEKAIARYLEDIDDAIICG